MLTIGDLARTTGVKVPTIRYYEQMGLLSHSERSEGNQRRYTRGEQERLSFIRHARELGLTIEAIRELIDLSQHPEHPCADADRIAQTQLQAVRHKIAKLTKLERELERIATHCHADSQIRDCYVIQSLANHDLCETDHD
jgi:DNA-binding transcriptional MerR regulator